MTNNDRLRKTVAEQKLFSEVNNNIEQYDTETLEKLELPAEQIKILKFCKEIKARQKTYSPEEDAAFEKMVAEHMPLAKEFAEKGCLYGLKWLYGRYYYFFSRMIEPIFISACEKCNLDVCRWAMFLFCADKCSLLPTDIYQIILNGKNK